MFAGQTLDQLSCLSSPSLRFLSQIQNFGFFRLVLWKIFPQRNLLTAPSLVQVYNAFCCLHAFAFHSYIDWLVGCVCCIHVCVCVCVYLWFHTHHGIHVESGQLVGVSSLLPLCRTSNRIQAVRFSLPVLLSAEPSRQPLPLLLNLKFDKLIIFSELFLFSGKGASTFSPSHPLLPLRQKQQKMSQAEDIPGESMILFYFPCCYFFFVTVVK